MRIILLTLCLLLAPLTAHAEELTAFIAASMTDAMKDVSAQWVQAGNQPLRMPFGSSSTLARQIEQGAPTNLFASADEKWMDHLAEKTLIMTDTRKTLLGNELVRPGGAGGHAAACRNWPWVQSSGYAWLEWTCRHR
jgi:molybdate transport system substrate-binding protein